MRGLLIAAFLVVALPAHADFFSGGAPGLPINGGTLTGAITVPSVTMNYTIAGPPTQYGQVNAAGTFNWPIGAAGGCCRTHYWGDTVTVTGNQAGSNVLETNFFGLTIVGTGTLTGEAFNIVHPAVSIPAGVTISGYAENFESSADNYGTISGALSGYLATFANNTGTINQYNGYRATAANNNATVGSFIGFNGFLCDGITGSGSAPTFNWCLINRDATASIVSAGGVRIGGIGNSNGPGTLAINGPDTSGGTYPLFVKSSTSNLLGLDDTGLLTLYNNGMQINGGLLSVGAAGSIAGYLRLNSITSGLAVQLVAGTTNSGVITLTLPTTAGTLALAPLSATSASIGGGSLAAGACASTATTVTGATVGMAVVATPTTYPGAGNIWNSYVSAVNTVTTQICAIISATPTASTYNVRVLQ